IGPVAYKLELPEKLYGIHNTFHVSNLKKCLADENLVIPLEEVQLYDKLHFIEEPVEIIDREVKQLKQSRIPIVKFDGIQDAVQNKLGNERISSRETILTCSHVVRKRTKGIEHRDGAPVRRGGCKTPIMPPKRRSQTNPQLTLTQEDVDYLVQDGIAAAIRDEQEKGAVGLVRWFEKIENTFEISKCAEVRKVKFATATLHGRALTWWNS
nr:reverse transcriptase domain-containing protein [Tanacetum cinerariifolium]